MADLMQQKHPEVKEIFINPEEENVRAVKCYLKAGFEDTREVMYEEGDRCLLLKKYF